MSPFGCVWTWVRAWAVVAAWAVAWVPQVAPTTTNSVRANVVDEVPGIDVGPLVAVTVARGDTARLPCRFPGHPDDSVSLVLWYLNHTTRPFLSYDARASQDTSVTGGGGVGGGRARMSLAAGGASLVISDTRDEDEAEYRCRVHFRLSPTWTQRLLLNVADTIEDIYLTDATGLPLPGGRMKPLPEGADLTLSCQATHGAATVVSLVWLLDGVDVDSTWAPATPGVAINQLTISHLEQRHRNAHLTCRLTTRDLSQQHVKNNITDVSTLINMFYVPEASLVVEGGRRSGSGGREVTEGKSVTFLCSVRADPPAYNITWLHNGRVVSMGGRRWRRSNSSLVVTPVSREDAGLYTCLASNSEGDGHSNAVLLRVAHTPYCVGHVGRAVVVAKNQTVTLMCQMEAVPKDLTFEWRLEAPPSHLQGKLLGKPGGAVLVPQGELGPPRRVPSLFDLTPSHPLGPDPWVTPAPRPWEPWDAKQDAPGGDVLPHRLDPDSPARSFVALTPQAPAQVICYARNRVGRTRVPCTYTLTVVEPPTPLQGCNVTHIEETRLEVKCDAQPRGPHAPDDHSPSLSFVRSPEASTRANLEVWSGTTLITNVSDARPVFTVRGLPPSTDLTLVLYAATAHARSDPVTMKARTRPRAIANMPLPPPPTHPTDSSDPNDKKRAENTSHPSAGGGGGGGGLGFVIGGLVGGLGIMILVLVLSILLIRRRQARRAAEEELAQPPDGLLTGGLPQELLDREVKLDTTKLPVHTPPPPRMSRHVTPPPTVEAGCSSSSLIEILEVLPALEECTEGPGEGSSRHGTLKRSQGRLRGSMSPKVK